MVLAVFTLGILTLVGVISKMAWASLLLGLIGKDVEVEEVANQAEYYEFQGLNIPEGQWQITESGDELIVENKSATIGIKTIEKDLQDVDEYLSSKALEISFDFSSNGMDTYSEKYMMCEVEAYIIVGESENINYMIVFWYMGGKIYTLNALYDLRAEADEVIYAISCV